MSKSKINILVLVVLLLAGAVQLFGQTIPPAGSEGKLIAVLKSDASHKEKADACRQLAIIGTKKAVAPLAALLGDEKLSHMARYGLEPNPDPAVDEALRDALGRLKGRPLVGVIGSIGVRRDAMAVRPLTRMLRNSDAQVAQAAARALGSIANNSAANSLLKALKDAPAANQLDVCEGLFRCAEALVAEGRRDVAIAIYDQLRKIDAAHQVRGGALRGAILTRGKDGVALLREHLRSDDYILFSAAVQAAQEMKGSDVTKALTAGLKGLAADNQILIIQTLGKRGDAAAVPALSDLAKSGVKSVRIAAIRALPDIGNASAVPVLVGLPADTDNEISKAAQEALAALPGREADAAVMRMLNSNETDRQLKALEMIERRRMTKVSSALLKATRDDDESVRTASIRVLGDLAGEVQFPVLVELLVNAGSSSEIRAAERALSATCTREAKPSASKVTIRRAVYGAIGEGGSADVTRKVAKIVAAGSLSVTASNANFGDPAPGIHKQLLVEYTVAGVAHTRTVKEGETLTLAAGTTPEAFIDQLCSALAKAPTPQKLALLRVLSVTGGPEALRAIRSAVNDSNVEVRSAAIRALCVWKTTDVAPDLLSLAKQSPNRSHKTAALRSYIGLARDESLSTEKKLAMCREAAALVQRNEEKKLLLGALGIVPAAEALSMAMTHLDNPATKEEACFAAVSVSEKIILQKPREVADALQKVLQATKNRDVTRRARKTLDEAKKRAGR